MICAEPLKGKMCFYEQCIKKNIRIPINKLKEFILFFQLFCIVPSGYYRLATILVYNTSAKTYLPSAYILMQNKHQLMYEMAFQALKLICKAYKITMNPTHVMSDFETAPQHLRGEKSGMTNALKIIIIF